MPLSRDPEKRARQLANLTARPPAPPAGNRRGAVHGGYSQVMATTLEAKARTIYDALASDAPVRGPDGGLPREDSVPVRLLAEALCRLDSVSEYLARHGWQDERGVPRQAVLNIEERLSSRALGLCIELGMTPRSRAALGLSLARVGQALDPLAGLAVEGRRLRMIAEARDDGGAA